MTYIINKVKRKKNNICLTIAKNEYVIDEFFYEDLLPYEGKEIKDKEFKQIIAFSNANHLLNRLYKKVFNKTISKGEFKLALKDIQDEDKQIIIDYLAQNGYLKDEDVIAYYKEIYQASKGKIAFKNFLYKKHISSKKINEALDDYNEDKDLALMEANRYLKNKYGSNIKLKNQLKMHLVTKGYSEELIDDIINKVIIDKEDIYLEKEINIYKRKYNNDYQKIYLKLKAKGYKSSTIKNLLKGGFNDYED